VGYPKLTMTECVVVALCIVGAAVLLVPYILNSRGKARSATCQYHEMKLILATRELKEQSGSIEPSTWPQQLAGELTDPQIIYHCPSDERQPRHEASYGINNRVDQLSSGDGEKGVFRDYNALVAAVVRDGASGNWRRHIAPRHFEFVNVLRTCLSLLATGSGPAAGQRRLQFFQTAGKSPRPLAGLLIYEALSASGIVSLEIISSKVWRVRIVRTCPSWISNSGASVLEL